MSDRQIFHQPIQRIIVNLHGRMGFAAFANHARHRDVGSKLRKSVLISRRRPAGLRLGGGICDRIGLWCPQLRPTLSNGQ